MEIIGLRLPLIKQDDRLADLILSALKEEGYQLLGDDILVVTEKIVAKSQGRLVRLEEVTPTQEAHVLAAKTGKDPRLVELILGESSAVLKTGDNFIITETLDGFVCANAGIDSSNVEQGFVKLLPENPDMTAEKLREDLKAKTGRDVGVVIADSFGRPFRAGSVGAAIGAAGVVTLWDRRGEADMFGKILETTRVAVADCIASAANLVTGDANEKIPVALIRGLRFSGEGRASDLIREREKDLFRKG